MLLTSSATETDLLAVAMQFYVRLRRVNGRIVDVQYMIENREYANHIIKYAESIIDADLHKHLEKFKHLCNPEPEQNVEPEIQAPIRTASPQTSKATWFLG